MEHPLNKACDNIWVWLENAKKYKINQGEETLTDNFLLYLASQKLSSIKIIQTPKNEEKIKGTDWEWWIGNDRQGYLRYAVQAKKLNSKFNRYTSLNHKVGKEKNAELQHEILEKYANANQAIPLYAFYNYLKLDDIPNEWNCPLPFDFKKLGCTVTPLKNIKIALENRGWRTFEKIHQFPETVPIRCLTVCPNIAILSTLNSNVSNKIKIKKFGVEAKIYDNPWGWISELSHLDNVNQMPRNYYDHQLGLYPKRILFMDTSRNEFSA